MLLTITAHGPSAGDLSHLLHKHPDKVQHFDVTHGVAHVLYPERGEDQCTAALLLEVDPIGLVRKGSRGEAGGFSLAQYVNDRPYAGSSLLAVTMRQVLGTALAGKCRARPELPQRVWHLELRVPAVACRGGRDLVERLFAPLGWEVTASAVPLDPQFPAWGDSPYVDLRLDGRSTLADALTQLYVLLPVLDDAKHYWVGPEEIDKLMRAGERWLPSHPEREFISARYLRHQRSLVASAVARLAQVDDAEPEAFDNAVDEEGGSGGVSDEAPEGLSLAAQRHAAVIGVLREARAERVVDLGCGDGSLVRELVRDPSFTEIVGADVSPRALDLAARRLKADHLPERAQERVRLMQSSVTYRDERLTGFDAIVLMEVIEHVDAHRLPAVARTVFGQARPVTVVVTTPNAEYNVRWPTLAAGKLRHTDHRFEWTREEFGSWAHGVADVFGYTVRMLPVGDVDPQVGSPTQLAVFTRADASVPAFSADTAATSVSGEAGVVAPTEAAPAENDFLRRAEQ